MCLFKFQERSEFGAEVLGEESTVFVEYFAVPARYTDVVHFNLIAIYTPNSNRLTLLSRDHDI